MQRDAAWQMDGSLQIKAGLLQPLGLAMWACSLVYLLFVWQTVVWVGGADLDRVTVRPMPCLCAACCQRQQQSASKEELQLHL